MMIKGSGRLGKGGGRDGIEKPTFGFEFVELIPMTPLPHSVNIYIYI